MSNTLLEAALKYADRGWKVFPCRPKLKVPLTSHGVNDATDNHDTIKAWWTRWPDANIALACGKGSGVYVVDVDLDSDKNVDGWSSMEEFGDLPVTVRQDSPRGGAHFLFKTDNPPKNKNNFRNGIDIRSEGYYIMLTPSISVQPAFAEKFPEGIAYEWTMGASPYDIPLAEFPDCFRPELEKPRLPWEQPSSKPKEKVRPSTEQRPNTAIVSNTVRDRAIMYLNRCQPAYQGQGGHDALLWAARALVSGFKMSRNEAVELLWTDYNPRCIPPWDSNNLAETKDFVRKVDEAIKTPCSKPDGWLLDGNEEDHYHDRLLEMGRESIALLLAKGEKAPEPRELPQPKETRWTDEMLSGSGYVGELIKFIESNNPRTQRKLALMAALSGAGALFGRKVKTVDNVRTNLYTFGIGPTSCGKDAPGSMVMELFRQAGAENIIGASRVTSDSAIEMEIEEHPVRLFCWDEVGEFLGSMKQAGVGSGNASHLGTIKPLLKELWSRAGKHYVGKRRVEGRRNFIQPHICIYGSATPDQFMAGLNSKDVSGGLIPRCLIAFTNEIPDLEIRYKDAPDSLVQITEAWYHRQIHPQPGDSGGDIKDVMMPHQIIVPETDQARWIWTQFANRCTDEMRKCEANGDSWSGMWGKAAENMRRIALILACSDSYEKPEINDKHMTVARDIVTASIEDTIEVIVECLSDSQAETDRQYVFKAIKAAGKRGIARTALTAKTGRVNKAVRNSCIEDLVDSGKVDMYIHPRKSKPWLWISPFGIAAMSEKIAEDGDERVHDDSDEAT